MNCPRCGKETEQSGTFCQFCGANLKEFLTKPFPRKRVGGIKTEKFAGLGGRFLGGLIDLFFVLLFDIMAAALVGVISWLFGRPDPVSETVRMLYQYYYHVPRTDASGQVVNAVVPPQVLLCAIIFLLLIPWIYSAYLESSRNQSTLGKLAVRVAVTDMQGNRITFSRATLRFFGKILCIFTLFIGFLIIAFNGYRQGLHDMIAGTLVFRQ